MQKSSDRGLRVLTGVYEDSANLQEKEREYLRALGILAESPPVSEEEMNQMMECYNHFFTHYVREYGKKYSSSNGDVDPKKAWFHSLLGEKWKTEQ